MVERIKRILEYYQLSPASFAEQIGINRSNVTHLFTGRNQPSLELAKKILHAYPEIKTEWLIMGVGEMLRTDEDKELIIKSQNERKQQKESAEPNLFSIFPAQSNIDTLHSKEIGIIEEKNAPAIPVKKEESFDTEVTIEEKKVLESSPISNLTLKKIVFFYSDNSFEVFHQKTDF